MRRSALDWIAEGALIALLACMVVLVVASIVMAPNECRAKAQRMGLNHEYDYVGGCMLEARPGVWVPMRNYRVEGGK